MTDEPKLPPASPPPDANATTPPGVEDADMAGLDAGAPSAPPPQAPAPPASSPMPPGDEEVIGERINRLSGEAAPDLSPEEFARLQRSGGAINIDPRGRIRVGRRDETDPGVSLRKRRAWYG